LLNNMTSISALKHTLSSVQNVDFEQKDLLDLLLFIVLTMIIYMLHFLVEEKGKSRERPLEIDQVRWDRSWKDMWRLANHTVMLVSSGLVLHRLNLLDLVLWPKDPSRMWFTEDGIPSDVKYLYLFHVANYTQDYIFWSLVSLPPEVVMMIIHHISTIILIIASFVKPNNWAGGLIVMTIHEPSDVLLAISKFFYYRSSSQLYIDVAFTIFAMS